MERMVLEDLGKVAEAAKACCLELDLRLDGAEAHEALAGLFKARPDLASSREVRAEGPGSFGQVTIGK